MYSDRSYAGMAIVPHIWPVAWRCALIFRFIKHPLELVAGCASAQDVRSPGSTPDAQKTELGPGARSRTAWSSHRAQACWCAGCTVSTRKHASSRGAPAPAPALAPCSRSCSRSYSYSRSRSRSRSCSCSCSHAIEDKGASKGHHGATKHGLSIGGRASLARTLAAPFWR